MLLNFADVSPDYKTKFLDHVEESPSKTDGSWLEAYFTGKDSEKWRVHKVRWGISAPQKEGMETKNTDTWKFFISFGKHDFQVPS